MSAYSESELQRTANGITADYFNEPLLFDMEYGMRGLNAVLEALQTKPMLTYEGRKRKLLAQNQDKPDYLARIEAMYEVTPTNMRVVARIDAYVSLMNRAARESRLTDALYQRLHTNLVGIRDAKPTSV